MPQRNERSPKYIYLKKIIYTILILFIAIVLAFLDSYIPRPFRPSENKPPLEQEVTTTLQALQENSRQAIELTARLQTEVGNRTKSLQEMETTLEELRNRRTLLDLTTEQQKALQSLVRRPQSTGEILTSKEFWLGNVFVNVVTGIIFFVLGVWYQYQRRKERMF